MKINWGTGIVIFFALFVSLAAVFIVFSLQYSNDLVVDNYYERGANYDVQMQMDKRSAPYTDSVNIETTGNAVKIKVAESIISESNTVDLLFYYASDKSKDVAASMNSTSLVLDKKAFAHGKYTLRISWKNKGETYYLKKDVFID